jgi:hypothetical protein
MTDYHKTVENTIAKLRDVESLLLGAAKDVDLDSLTPRELHELGLCNKAQLHYECHGRSNYQECS